MSSKTPLATGITGSITAGSYTFEVTDPANFLAIVAEGLGATDALQVLNRDMAGTGWQPYTEMGRGSVVLTRNGRHATPSKPGVYTVSGVVTGVINLYTEGV